MAIPYVKQTWVDGSGGGTPTSAARLGVIEQGINDVSYAPAVRVFNTADQAITASTWTAVTFGSEDFDTAGNAADTMHDNVTNNHRLTCRYAGKYMVTGHASWAANTTAFRHAAIVKNATTPAQGDFVSSVGAFSAGGPRQVVTGLYDLAVNDWVALCVFQDTAGALNLLGTTAATRALFGMVRVG